MTSKTRKKIDGIFKKTANFRRPCPRLSVCSHGELHICCHHICEFYAGWQFHEVIRRAFEAGISSEDLTEWGLECEHIAEPS